MSGLRILLVDSRGSGEACASDLRDLGFSPTLAGSLGGAVRQVVVDAPDVVLAVVDDAAARETCEVLRALGPYALIVAGEGLSSGVAAACLDGGSDAMFNLPLPAAELAARIQAVCRRVTDKDRNCAPSQFVAGDLTIDPGQRAVSLRGREVELSSTEFNVLRVLAEGLGRVVTNRELLMSVWGEEYVDDLHYVRLYIGYLRSKLEDDPRHPKRILTHWGVGYRLVTGNQGAVAERY